MLSGSFLFCIIFLFVITASPTYSILFLINISSPNSGSTSCVYELPSNSGANSPFRASFFFLSIFSSLFSFLLPPLSSKIFMQRSLVKLVSLFQPCCVHLNPYDRQHHCEKQTPYDILGKSILLLDHLGACM